MFACVNSKRRQHSSSGGPGGWSPQCQWRRNGACAGGSDVARSAPPATTAPTSSPSCRTMAPKPISSPTSSPCVQAPIDQTCTQRRARRAVARLRLQRENYCWVNTVDCTKDSLSPSALKQPMCSIVDERQLIGGWEPDMFLPMPTGFPRGVAVLHVIDTTEIGSSVADKAPIGCSGADWLLHLQFPVFLLLFLQFSKKQWICN